MPIYPGLAALSLGDLVCRFHDPPPDGPEYAAGNFDEVALLIRERGNAGVEFLLDALSGTTDPDRLDAAILGLTDPPLDRAGFHGTLKPFLRHENSMLVAAAIDGLRRQQVLADADEVLALTDHESPYVRGAVQRFVRHLDRETAVPTLIAGLKDPHFVVRENAVDELDELGVI